MKENEPITLNKQTNHQELKFLKNDLIGGFLNKDTFNLIKNVSASFKKGEKRNFAQDVEKIVNRFNYEIQGLDNIPRDDHSSLIIEMNHPPIRDFLEGAFLISYFFPAEIHWFMGENVPRRNLKGIKIFRPVVEKGFKKIDSLIKKIIETYDFIGVPTKEMENAESRRGSALMKGIKYLQNNQNNPIIAILPEGEFEKDNQLEPFNDGIGLMIKKLKDENLRVLPVRVKRDEQKALNIVIGPSYKPDYHLIWLRLILMVNKLIPKIWRRFLKKTNKM